MIRMHITVEGESVRQCADMLKSTASAYYHLADAQRLLEDAPKDGVRTELKIGDDVLAVVSVEDDVTLCRHGKMPLRWGPSKPAFEGPPKESVVKCGHPDCGAPIQRISETWWHQDQTQQWDHHAMR